MLLLQARQAILSDILWQLKPDANTGHEAIVIIFSTIVYVAVLVVVSNVEDGRNALAAGLLPGRQPCDTSVSLALRLSFSS